MILKRILKVCFVALFGCLIICFLTAPFVFNQNNQVGQHKIVCADTVDYNYAFYSSNLSIPLLFLNTDSWSGVSSSSIVYQTTGFYSLNSNGITFTSPIDFYRKNNSVDSLFISETFRVFDDWVHNTIYHYDSSVSAEVYLKYSYYIQSDFNFNVTSVRIYTVDYRDNHYFRATSIVYFDNNGKYFTLQILGNSLYLHNYPELYELSDRTYFFYNNLTDNEAYQAGVQFGMEQGLASNQQSVYDRGFSAGKLQGDDEGYRRGVNEANQYNFFNLMGAVMDAPVKAFIGLFNFNFLGVNLLNIASGIVTFAVVVRIVRLVLGGR